MIRCVGHRRLGRSVRRPVSGAIPCFLVSLSPPCSLSYLGPTIVTKLGIWTKRCSARRANKLQSVAALLAELRPVTIFMLTLGTAHMDSCRPPQYLNVCILSSPHSRWNAVCDMETYLRQI